MIYLMAAIAVLLFALLLCVAAVGAAVIERLDQVRDGLTTARKLLELISPNARDTKAIVGRIESRIQTSGAYGRAPATIPTHAIDEIEPRG